MEMRRLRVSSDVATLAAADMREFTGAVAKIAIKSTYDGIFYLVWPEILPESYEEGWDEHLERLMACKDMMMVEYANDGGEASYSMGTIPSKLIHHEKAAFKRARLNLQPRVKAQPPVFKATWSVV